MSRAQQKNDPAINNKMGSSMISFVNRKTHDSGDMMIINSNRKRLKKRLKCQTYTIEEA